METMTPLSLTRPMLPSDDSSGTSPNWRSRFDRLYLACRILRGTLERISSEPCEISSSSSAAQR